MKKNLFYLPNLLLLIVCLCGTFLSLTAQQNLTDVNHSTSKSSFLRELAYCLDHRIHHQSLIKIGLTEQGLDHLIDENFGVAFFTQNYRNECAS
ncbi:hypothetical protein OAQ04_03240 [Flavobacteriaceae bacterium]|nr:hypothetical protein [Flavobacteriaceae bacterium]